MGIETEEPNQKPPTFWQILHSMTAAAFSVQSGRNRARDFSHGKPVHFIMLGLLFTPMFVLLLAEIMELVLSLSDLQSLRRRGGLSPVADPEHRGSYHQQDQSEDCTGVDHTVVVFLSFVRLARDSPCLLWVSGRRHRKAPSS